MILTTRTLFVAVRQLAIEGCGRGCYNFEGSAAGGDDVSRSESPMSWQESFELTEEPTQNVELAINPIVDAIQRLGQVRPETLGDRKTTLPSRHRHGLPRKQDDSGLRTNATTGKRLGQHLEGRGESSDLLDDENGKSSEIGLPMGTSPISVRRRRIPFSSNSSLTLLPTTAPSTETEGHNPSRERRRTCLEANPRDTVCHILEPDGGSRRRTSGERGPPMRVEDALEHSGRSWWTADFPARRPGPWARRGQSCSEDHPGVRR